MEKRGLAVECEWKKESTAKDYEGCPHIKEGKRDF